MNNKMQSFSISWIAALPAAALAAMLVMAIVKTPGFDNFTTGMKVVVALTLLTAIGVFIMPIAILIFAPKAEPAAGDAAADADASTKAQETPAAAAADEDLEAEAADEIEDLGGDDFDDDELADDEAGDDFDDEFDFDDEKK